MNLPRPNRLSALLCDKRIPRDHCNRLSPALKVTSINEITLFAYETRAKRSFARDAMDYGGASPTATGKNQFQRHFTFLRFRTSGFSVEILLRLAIGVLERERETERVAEGCGVYLDQERK